MNLKTVLYFTIFSIFLIALPGIIGGCAVSSQLPAADPVLPSPLPTATKVIVKPTPTPQLIRATSTSKPRLSQSSAVVTVNGLNVRQGPDKIYRRNGIVFQGDVLEILGQHNECSWLYVRTPSRREGWVISKFLHLNLECTQLPEMEPPPMPTNTPEIDINPTAVLTLPPSATPDNTLPRPSTPKPTLEVHFTPTYTPVPTGSPTPTSTPETTVQPVQTLEPTAEPTQTMEPTAEPIPTMDAFPV